MGRAFLDRSQQPYFSNVFEKKKLGIASTAATKERRHRPGRSVLASVSYPRTHPPKHPPLSLPFLPRLQKNTMNDRFVFQPSVRLYESPSQQHRLLCVSVRPFVRACGVLYCTLLADTVRCLRRQRSRGQRRGAVRALRAVGRESGRRLRSERAGAEARVRRRRVHQSCTGGLVGQSFLSCITRYPMQESEDDEPKHRPFVFF